MALSSYVRKLFTKEDSLHLHKTLGVLALLHYAYRFALLLLYGTMRLDEPYTAGWLAVHGALSASSLIFPIPRKRHATLPMIYPEFRLHSILFGLRSVVCCLIACYAPTHPHALYGKMGTCVLAMVLADAVTARHAAPGDTTMRAMPFSEATPDDDRRRITRFHSNQQTTATVYMLWTRETAFCPLMAIQLAAFLMTLVRKGLIAPNTWHVLYSWTLMVNVLALYTMPLSQIVVAYAAKQIFRVWRMRWRLNKYTGWALVFALVVWLDASWLDDAAYADVGRWLVHGLVATYLAQNVYATRRLYARSPT